MQTSVDYGDGRYLFVDQHRDSDGRGTGPSTPPHLELLVYQLECLASMIPAVQSLYSSVSEPKIKRYQIQDGVENCWIVSDSREEVSYGIDGN